MGHVFTLILQYTDFRWGADSDLLLKPLESQVCALRNQFVADGLLVCSLFQT